MKENLVFGLDIGGTAIKAVALSKGRNIVFKTETPSRASEGPSHVVQAIVKSYESLLGKTQKPVAIGLGCAGSVDRKKGVVRNSPNFFSWTNVPLVKEVRQHIDVEVHLENDAKCAVLGEWLTGAGRGFRNLVLVTFGTGIGGGLVLDGKLYRGSTGTAGELGHMSIRSNGIVCPCGNTGCFERYCSASALHAKIGSLTVEQFFARSTEPSHASIFETFISDIVVGLTSIANQFDPDCILVGGGISYGLAPHLTSIEKRVKEHAFPAVGKHLKILPTLHGNWSGAIGAANLVNEHPESSPTKPRDSH